MVLSSDKVLALELCQSRESSSLAWNSAPWFENQSSCSSVPICGCTIHAGLDGEVGVTSHPQHRRDLRSAPTEQGHFLYSVHIIEKLGIMEIWPLPTT